MASKFSDNPASTRHPPFRFRSAGYPTHRAEQVPEHPHIRSLVPTERSKAVRDGRSGDDPAGRRHSFAPARQGAGSRWQRSSPPGAWAGAARVSTRSRRARSDTGAAPACPVCSPRLLPTPTGHALATSTRNARPRHRSSRRLTPTRHARPLHRPSDNIWTWPSPIHHQRPEDRKTGERQGTR